MLEKFKQNLTSVYRKKSEKFKEYKSILYKVLTRVAVRFIKLAVRCIKTMYIVYFYSLNKRRFDVYGEMLDGLNSIKVYKFYYNYI